MPDVADEIFELVNETGEVIGTAPRSECHGNPKLAHRAVHIFVRNASGDILLQKRASNKRIQPGKWDTSVGGHLSVGESFTEAAMREVEEEVGVEVTELKKLHEYIWRTEVETEHIETFSVTHEGPFARQESEISELRFWSINEIRENLGAGIFTPNLEHELRLIGIG